MSSPCMGRRNTGSPSRKIGSPERGRHRSRVREFINSLSRDLSAKRKFFSPKRHKSKERTIRSSISNEWKPPSEQTISIVLEIFSKLFTDPDNLDLDMIERALTLCPPDEDILLIEDRDHYNLLHKAIILGNTQLITILLNHGCDINGAKSFEECSISKKACPHENLGALHLAAFLGRQEILTLLLQRGSDRTLAGRVYTSEVVNDPRHLQPQLLHSSQQSRKSEILNKCGCRQPIFYAVVGNHVEIVKILLGDNASDHYGYLVHLACRVGSFDCLKYLLYLFPEEMDRKDGDGLPLLLMALNHDLRFVTLLLQYGADVFVLNDLWAPGSNILHLLYTSMPLDGEQDAGLISKVTEICISRGVAVNSLRSPFHRTPMHDLMTVINLPVVGDPLWRAIDPQRDLEAEQKEFDEDLIKCVELLLGKNADVNLRDSNNKTPLQILLSNGNHTVRCNMHRDSRTPSMAKEAMKVHDFGVQNTIRICSLLLQSGRTVVDNRLCSTPLIDLVEMICSSYFGSDYWAWVHALEILETPAMCEGYVEIIRQLLAFGFDPNVCPPSQLPPLLYLLSHVADSPFADDYVIPTRTVRPLTSIIRAFLEFGARTEVQVDCYRDGIKTFSCFDMLVPVLSKLKKYKQKHSAAELESLKVLSLALLQHGAKAVVFQKLLFKRPENIGSRWSDCLPFHSVLYQLLQFGLHNLDYVNDGEHFKAAIDIFYTHTDHTTLHVVLDTILVQLAELHPEPCQCGHCPAFTALVHALAQSPRSLKQQCRLVINKTLGKQLLKRRLALPLPRPLQDYLVSFLR